MPKNIEDIIPSNRRTIRDIPVPTRKSKEVLKPVEPERSLPRLENDDYAPRRRPKSPKRNLIIGGIVGGIVLIFLILALQSGATLAYTPKTSTLAFANDSYTAYQAASDGQLPFSVIKLSGDKSVNVPATGEENASEKASGRVIIYNEQASPQQLVKTTRLETQDGKVYRIKEDVTVPAKGNIETTAIADQPGESYNIPLSDFTLPGLKGSAKFEQVYARSKTPISGGFTGVRKKVSDADLSKAKSSLESSLKGELLTQAKAQMPADFVLFPDMAYVTYEVLPVENAGETNAKVTLRGNLAAAIFKKADLSQYLAVQKLGASNLGTDVSIDDFTPLNIAPAVDASNIGRAESLRLTVSGTARIRYLTDKVALASDLVGVPKKDIATVLKRYPSIETAKATLRPFWKSSFPNDVSEIKIEERN